MIEKSFSNYQLEIKFNSYVDEKCKIWFKAKEVAQILGYKNTEKAIERHVSENHKRTFLLSCPRESRGQVIKSCQCKTHGQVQGRWIILIDEPGFYELVFKSRLPSARIFREWVFAKVLPSIRKFGYYKMIDTRIKRRVIIEGVKYYKHPVFSNYAASKNGDVINVKTKRILKVRNNGNGYLNFGLCDKKLEKTKNYYQHRFVYEVFRGPIPRCFEVDHQNNVRSDNRIKNLQLLTHKQNVEKSKNRPIISTNIENGKEKRYISIKTAAIELDINSSHICEICRKKCKTATSKKNKKIYTFKYLD